MEEKRERELKEVLEEQLKKEEEERGKLEAFRQKVALVHSG